MAKTFPQSLVSPFKSNPGTLPVGIVLRDEPGSMSDDNFIINDVVLRIPPENIQVEKKAFNHEWQTLRTKSSQKSKSGYGTARVVIQETFRVSNSKDQDNLRRLVAGLRSTPFCVVYSSYLDSTLGRPDISSNSSVRPRDPDIFQPIMLSLTSMTFSTMGHEGKPDCVSAVLDFVWFNYLPFTSHIAFKGGDDFNRPGHAWDSALWKAFYQPYLQESSFIDFPHQPEDSFSRRTQFMWREFTVLPYGHPAAIEASLELVNALKKQPNKVVQEMKQMISEATEGENPDPSILTEDAIGTLRRRLIKDGVINANEEIEKQLQALPPGSVTKVSEGTISPIFKKISNKSKFTQADMSEVDKAGAILASRLRRLKDDGQSNVATFNEINSQGYVKLLDHTSKTSNQEGEQYHMSGLELFGRKNFYTVHNGGNTDATIQRISVSFQNILATIPMVGYTYPTAQHIGSIDARVNMTLIAKDPAVRDINTMYDTVETMAVRYRQIPAGYNNLVIANDFLSLFGIKEFLTESIQTSPISGSPGHNILNLNLIDAGVNSSTKLNDAEEFSQEFLRGDTKQFKKIWKVLFRDMIQRANFQTAVKLEKTDNYTKFKNGYQWVRPGNNTPNSNTSKGFYALDPAVISDTRSLLYAGILTEAVNAYNEFMNTAHDLIFGGGKKQQAEYVEALNTISEEGGKWEYVPGLNRLKKGIKERHAILIKSANSSAHGKELNLKSNKKVEEYNRKAQLDKEAHEKAEKIGSKKTETKLDNFTEEKKKIEELVRRMGIEKYVNRMRAIFEKVYKFRKVDQFKQLFGIEEERDFIGHGKNAYPDFREALTTVNNLVEGKVVRADDAVLNKYDPDCYFWYPFYSGGTKSDVLDFIDPYYKAAAKDHSKRIHQLSREKVTDFYNNKFVNYLKASDPERTYKSLVSKGATELNASLYENQEIRNSTRHSTGGIIKNVICDVGLKSPTNWYDKEKLHISSGSILDHSVNIEELWDGTSEDPTNPDRLSSNIGQDALRDPASNNPSDLFWKPKDSINLAWPIKGDIGRMSKGGKYGAKRRAYANFKDAKIGQIRYHKGIDIPGPDQLKRGAKKGPGDGIYGDPVLAAADGTVVSIQGPKYPGGLMVFINHGGGWQTGYLHLEPGSLLVKERQRVRKGKQIARIGRTGNKNSNTHLHFQVKYKGRAVNPTYYLPSQKAANAQRWHPKAEQIKEMSKPAQDTAGKNIAESSLSSALDLSIKEFEKDLYNGQGQTMMRAYPTFKLYFVEDDTSEKSLAFDDFFGYNSVQSIRVVRSRKIAADLCEIVLTNISGTLSNRKFSQNRKNTSPHTSKGELSKESTKAMNADTSKENPFASLMLQEGMNIHLRLGYASDPARLPVVFNGVITAVQFTESDELVKIIAQSYAIELVQDMKGITEAEEHKTWWGWRFLGFKDQGGTGNILEQMLAEPEVVHFGRWRPNRGGDTYGRTLLTNRHKWEPQPSDDNIFAPSPDSETSSFGQGWVFNKVSYIVYKTTVWDIMQEMTLRHPNFIASVVPYEDEGGRQRMTAFYGLPNQLYFAKAANGEDVAADQKLQDEANRDSVKILEDLRKGLVAPNSPEFQNLLKHNDVRIRELATIAKGAIPNEAWIKRIKEVTQSELKSKRLKQAVQSEWISPFRKYHLFTSDHHVIANNIRANSRDVANTIVVQFTKDVDTDELGQIVDQVDKEVIVKLDSTLPPEEQRSQIGQFMNVNTEELAKRYGLGMLMRNIKDIYKGELIVLGNPSVKPYDVGYLFDSYTDMIGAFEVEEVQHVFTQQTGFRTEIKPDMLCAAQEWSVMSSAHALSTIMGSVTEKMIGSYTKSGLSSAFKYPAAGIGFILGKIINFTPHAQPVMMAPLMYHGRPFTGGVPSRKLPTAWWDTFLDKFDASIDAGFHNWWDDVTDGMSGWVKGVFGQYQQGDFFNQGGDSPQ